jgi:nucleotide-binding universal stress UspA family protein
MAGIVVGVDDSGGSAAALRWAAAEARRRDTPLTAVHAYLRPLAHIGTDADMVELEAERRGQAQLVLDQVLATAAEDLANLDVGRGLHRGQAAQGLLSAAAAADILVVGTQGAGGLEGVLLGSTAEQCARHATCPVVLVPETPTPGSGRLLVGVDGSAPARAALVWAVEEAALRGAAVDVLTVYEPYRKHGPFGADFMDVASPGWRARFRQAAEQVADEAVAGVASDGEIAVHAEAGHVAKVLVAWSERADLLVMGHRGRGGFDGLHLGSVTRQVLHHTACPVVVVRPRPAA